MPPSLKLYDSKSARQASSEVAPTSPGFPIQPMQSEQTAVNKGMPKEVVEYWDQRIKQDYINRSSSFDKTWDKNYELIRNSGNGFRNGNLAAEFVRTLQLRLLASDPQIVVRPDDPDYATQAEAAEIVSQSVARTAKLKDVLYEASIAATWASVGWIEVGHPLDSWSLDVMRSNASPGLHRPGGEALVDDYQEVDAGTLENYGLNLDQVEPFDPFSALPEPDPDPVPLFDPTFGYPWARSVDPRLVVTNPLIQGREQVDYLCRFYFLTRKELERLTGFQYPQAVQMKTEYRDLFQRVEGMDIKLFPEMLMVACVWVIRDRNNPEYNSWQLCYVFGEPDKVVYQGPNRHGGMVNLIPVKLSRMKKFYDTTLAQELAKYADIFDIGVKAMFRNIKRQLNKKWAVPQHAGLQPEDDKKITNDDFQGTIKVSDPNAIKELVEEKIDAQLLNSLNWVKGLAQSQSGASDLDRGQAIKDITARQTQALLEATGINVEGMKDTVSAAAAETTMKLMHLVGIYNHAGRSRKYQVGNKIVSMDRGTHDFTSSYVYDVQVQDSKLVVSNEERIVWTQLLKTLFVDTGGVLLPYLDREYVAKATVRKFGEGPEMLASRGAGRPGMGEPLTDLSQVDPALSGGGGPGAGAPKPPGIMDAVYGQHPERELGSQGGPNISNALVGLRRTGS